jgi:L-threonylcarbamoyladenylate synthase
MLDSRARAGNEVRSESMPSRIVPIAPDDPREDRLDAAVRLLRGGGIVALPTETFYGLAADPFRSDALARLNALKGREPASPILLLLADRDQAGQVARELSGVFSHLAEMFWPGPLTLVVPAVSGLPAEVTGGRGTVGIRVPGLALPRHLAAALGRPITGPSANLHGQPPCRTAGEVVRAFPDGVGVVLDGGPTAGGAPSTVLDLTGPTPLILRVGAVPRSALRPYLEGI